MKWDKVKMSKKKVHYYRLNHDTDHPRCGIIRIDPDRSSGKDDPLHDHKQTTCLRCVSSMNIDEQSWHDENNKQWDDSKAGDGRRLKQW